VDQKVVHRVRQIDPLDVHVGRRVKQRRMQLAMSQGKLGEHLKLTFQQVQKYENGTNRISAGLLPYIAKALAVTITYFFEGIESELPNAQPRSAEEESRRLVMEFVSSSEGANLIRAFLKITDPKVRRRTFNLVKSLVAEEPDEPGQK
jgi:transcriptional regulator with XRE-family HTH domain